MDKPKFGNCLPLISVVISTRNRGDSVNTAVKSILNGTYSNFELLIIDQSEDSATEEAVQSFLPDARFHYLRSNTKGCAAGRNLGIENALSDFIAITDDDCEVAENWLCEMVKAFKVDRQVGIVFGNVLAGDHDPKAGFIPTYIRREPFLARSIWQKNFVRGITANAGVKRSVWQKVNRFDEMLGAGAPLRAASEGDFAIKVLLAGFRIYETPKVKVFHNGFRTWKEGQALARRNWYGIGAAVIKHLKLGRWAVIPILVYEWLGIAMGQLLKNILVSRRLSGVTPVIAFCQGFMAGFQTPVDRGSGNYRLRKTRL